VRLRVAKRATRMKSKGGRAKGAPLGAGEMGTCGKHSSVVVAGSYVEPVMKCR
jgi:hypothetical protein